MTLQRDLNTTLGVMKLGPKCHRLVSPCCRATVQLFGQPAPQYHCFECGKVFGKLEELVTVEGT